MTNFEWFLLIVVVIIVPLIVAVVVTLWTIDQANKRKRANRADAQIGVKRKAALSPEEVAERKAQRAASAQDVEGDIPVPPEGDPGGNDECVTVAAREESRDDESPAP